MARKSRIARRRVISVAGMARPLSQEKACSGIAALNQKIVEKQTRLAEARQRDSRESLRAMRPLLKLLRDDTSAQRAAKNLSRLREARRKPKFRYPAALQRVEEHTRTGSILSFIIPPYPLRWGGNSPPKNTTWGTWVAEQTKVGNIIDARLNASINVGSGGNAWASAGLGTIFVPAGLRTTFVRIGLPAPYDWQYNDRSNYSTAHSDGLIAIYVQSFDLNGQNPKDEVDRRIPVFSDGTAWTQSHADEEGGHYPSDTYFMADKSRFYLIWAWCNTSGDGSGDDNFSSYASGSVSVSLPFMVIEQWT